MNPILKIIIAFVVSAFVFASGPAFAVGGHEEIFIRKGVELRKKGRDRDALVEFQKAFDVAHTPRAAAQLGLCEQSLKDWLRAHLHLSVALASESDTWVSQHRSTLEDSRRDVEKHLGRIDVQGKPAGALVVVGGDVVGRLSETLSVQVMPGPTTVTVTADGYTPFNETRIVEAGTAVQVAALLSQLPAPVETEAAKAPSSPVHLTTDAQSLATPESTSLNNWFAWVGWGAGGGLVGAGVFFGFRASAKAEEARTAETFSAAAENAANSARRLQWVCLGAGAVSVAVGTLFYLKSSNGTEVALAPSLGSTSLVLRGRW